MPVKICNISTTLLEESGSACSIFNRSLASKVVECSPHASRIQENASPQLRIFSNETIRIDGILQAPITRKGTTSHSVTLTVVADGLKSLNGSDLFNHLDLAVKQSSSSGYQVNIVSSSSDFKKNIAQIFPNLI